MSTEEVRPSPAGSSPQYNAGAWLIGWVVFLGSGSVTSVLLLHSWASCHLGRHAQPFMWLVVAAIGTATASTVLWAVMRKVTGRRGLLVPLAWTVLATAVLLWLVLATWYRSPGHPHSLCEPGRVQVGWPG
ncbi:hypothetical protein [Streptomyces sp. NPDC048521]|uniref:hypothetical protein n=1 Tax=Streptomyces sp. NPDC048521 TaxID=3365566 RepID=UPI003710E36C